MPFGSHGSNPAKEGQGARLSKKESHVIHRSIASMRQWFVQERMHGHEVKRHHMRMRFQMELESEIGRQRVLCEHERKNF